MSSTDGKITFEEGDYQSMEEHSIYRTAPWQSAAVSVKQAWHPHIERYRP